MADIAEITNAEAGSSVRTKLNTIRTYINSLKNLTGLVKVSGEALSAASAGTDYQAPLSKASAGDINTGTDDDKFATSKAIADSKIVKGPTSVTLDSNIAVYDGTSGKLLKDSTVSLGDLESAVSDTVKYGTTITDNADITYANHAGKTTLVNKSTAVNLTLKKADWVAGKWSVFRHFGDGQFTIVAEDANVKLPANVKSAGKGFDMYIECYLISGSNKYFHIVGGIA